MVYPTSVYTNIGLFTKDWRVSIIKTMIEPIIDLKQYNTDEKVEEYAESYFEFLAENKSMINAQRCIFKGRINEKIQERRIPAYDVIAALVNTEEYTKVKQFDNELNCMTIAADIYRMERDHMQTTLFDSFDYVDDFFRIYNKILFFLRRIQIGVNIKVMVEFPKYLRERKLSVFVPMCILYSSQLGDKELIALDLAKLYYEQRSLKDALFIICFAIEKSRNEYVAQLEAYRDMMMEELM